MDPGKEENHPVEGEDLNKTPIEDQDEENIIMKDIALDEEEEALENDEEDVAEKVEDPSDADELNGFWQRIAKRTARHPRIHFWVAFLTSLAIGVVGLVAGNFSVAANNAGWQSRGTKIANRETQNVLVRINRFDLFTGDEAVWDDLINNVQPGWETDDDEAEDAYTRMLSPAAPPSWHEMIQTKSLPLSEQIKRERRLPFEMTDHLRRRLQAQNDTGLLDGCDLDWYDGSTMAQDTHLWSVWKTKKSENTALDPELIRDLCESEEKTQEHLIKEDLCITCQGGGCLQPYGLVFYVRLTVDAGFSLTCDELADAWTELQAPTEAAWVPCVEDLKVSFDVDASQQDIPDSCPFGFYPTLLDELYDSTTRVGYSSTIFATIDDVDKLFDKVSGYDRGTNLIKGAYDTNNEDFVNKQVDNSLVNDMALALGSAFITALAILVHTRSPFLTLIGILQIVLSFPLAFFVYTFIARLEFFPFLNFIGVFVVFALGADDVFVAVDKWKNARLKHWDKSTEYVAAKALPDAGGAMFLTTITTAVAFFGTAICPVAPILCFAVFCGLLIIFDYIMCVVLVFPALCMYDRTREVKNRCMRCHCCNRFEAAGPNGAEDDDNPSLIRRILLKFYEILHRFRWISLVICMAGFGVSAYFASTLELPESSDVRLLDAKKYQYEQNFEWRLNLLYDVLSKQDGSQAYVLFGTKAADTGDHNNPDKFSQLVLDESFDPSNEDVQVYLQGFCDQLFAQDFATEINPDYACPINQFDAWLQEQSQSATPEDDYTANCGGATGLPVSQGNFDACVIAWSQQSEFVPILPRGGVVEIMYVPFNSKIRFDSPYDDIDDEWREIDEWMENQRKNVAPLGVRGFYHTSQDFWWYDTNGQMLSTAYGAAAIALGTAGAVILFSSRSVTLTIFAILTIGFILVAVTACLVGIGWSLGFLESVCFAILIGVSCDFVIHFAHAYAALPGMHSRGERTKHALILMGPSILAAAFTTIAAAIIMLFTVISFFEKFATILFLTVVLSTVGSFLVFITMADCIGPTHPTFLMDLMIAKCMRCCKKKNGETEVKEGAEESGGSSNEEPSTEEDLTPS